MYSIQIKNGEKSYIYAINEDGTVFKGSKEATTAKLKELAKDHALSKLSVVRNVNLTANFEIEDAE